MSDKDFVTKYLKGFSSLIKSNNDIINKIIKVRDILIGIKKNNKKIMIFGNGRSAAGQRSSSICALQQAFPIDAQRKHRQKAHCKRISNGGQIPSVL